MSRDHEGDIKQYIHTAGAWYAKSSLSNADYLDEVMFGFYSPDGGTSGEMGVRWYNLGTKWKQLPSGYHQIPHIAPKLEVFSDAWHTLAQFKDVIDKLAEVDGEDITPRDFCQVLESCGFVDNTPRDEKKRAELEAAYGKQEEEQTL